MIDKNSFTVTETGGFRLRVEYWKCLQPTDLFAVNFIQENLDEDALVKDSSTYNFFLNENDIKTLGNILLNAK